MSNADQPGANSQTSPAPSFEDIPVAVREVVEAPPKPKSNRGIWLILLGAIVLAAGGWFAYQWYLSRTVATSPSNVAPSPAAASPAPDKLLGHFPYTEAPEAELESVSDDGGIKLRIPAARAFREMVAAAAADGIILVPLSGFRSLAEQQEVYFGVKQERAQTPTERAQVSAPPGYSEHHTGYAIDIGDGNVPATNLSPNFENTAAFQWLKANAVRFSFEMSFDRNNQQGVTYEPWHWRFVGDKDSLETFYKAKQLQQGQASPSPDAPVSPSPETPVSPSPEVFPSP